MTELLIDIESGGYKPGEMSVMMAGRNSGKSIVFNNLCQEILMNEPVTFEIREKRWHGCRYDVVRPNNVYKMQQWQDMSSWCVKSFGDAGDAWNPSSSRWYENGGAFWFRRPADLTAFMLRWA